MTMPAVDDAVGEIPIRLNEADSPLIRLGAGWHQLEWNGAESYRWTEPDFEILLEVGAECLVLDGMRTSLLGAADCLVTGPLGWTEVAVGEARGPVVIDLKGVIAGPGRLRLSLSRVGRAPPDPRVFGLCVFDVHLASGLAANQFWLEKALRELPSTARHHPDTFTIASSDRCNLRCVMCGTHHSQTADNNAGREDLKDALVRKIEPVAGGAMKIQLHGGAGEPLFNRNFWKLAGLFSHVPGRQMEIHTNGLLFSPRHISELMKSGITHVSVSFDAATQEMFHKVRGANLSIVINNVKNMVAARRESQRKDLKITANMTVFQANIHEAPALVELAHDLGVDGVILMHMNSGEAYDWVETKADGWVFDYRANLPEADPHHVLRHVNRAVARAEALGLEIIVDSRLRALEEALARPSEPVPTPQATPLEPAPVQPALEASAAEASPPPSPAPDGRPQYRDCRTPWKWMNVAVNGDVYPCCWAAKPVGNLNDVDTLADIWNGSAMRELRSNIRENRLESPACVNASCIYVAYGEGGAPQ